MKRVKPRDADIEYQVKLWDHFGRNRYGASILNILTKVDGVILLFDLSNNESFRKAQYTFDFLLNQENSKICRLLVGNKFDLNDKRGVSYDEVVQYAT